MIHTAQTLRTAAHEVRSAEVAARNAVLDKLREAAPGFAREIHEEVSRQLEAAINNGRPLYEYSKLELGPGEAPMAAPLSRVVEAPSALINLFRKLPELQNVPVAVCEQVLSKAVVTELRAAGFNVLALKVGLNDFDARTQVMVQDPVFVREHRKGMTLFQRMFDLY